MPDPDALGGPDAGARLEPGLGRRGDHRVSVSLSNRPRVEVSIIPASIPFRKSFGLPNDHSSVDFGGKEKSPAMDYLFSLK
jgi:hypothetical protein